MWCVVPAAGCGRRFDAGDLPKQYHLVLGKPLAEWTLTTLLKFEPFTAVVVALSQTDEWFPRLPAAKHPRLMRCEGGNSRWHSVLQSLRCLEAKARPTDWVFVHDVARPCITKADLTRLLSFCRAQGDQGVSGGVLGVPVADSLKRVVAIDSKSESPEVLASADRTGLWRAFTPQAARFGDLHAALQKVADEQGSVNDEAEALELVGKSVVMVPGSPDNIKVTYPGDLEKVEAFLKAACLKET